MKSRIISTIGIILLAWILLSWGNCVSEIDKGTYNYASWNAISMVFESKTEEIPCEVVDIYGEYVIVECNGNEYAFYGNGYTVGQEIICEFTNQMEIIDVK